MSARKSRTPPDRNQAEKRAQKQILVVEDSPTQAQALTAALEEAGYRVTVATNGDEALSRLGVDRFDVVVSDILMPGQVDGYELCRRIKSGPLHETPVVLFTSLADPLDIIRGLECGADNFFTKSHGSEHLVRRIKALLETREARAHERSRLGINVFFFGREFTITSEREQILDLLMSTFEDAVVQNRELRRREEELARSHQFLRGLYQLAAGLNQVSSQADVLGTALERALELPGVKAGWVFLRDGETGLRLAAARNLPPALERRDMVKGDCLCCRRLLAGEPNAVTNVRECERLQRARRDTRGLRYHASIPLRVAERTVGVMNLVGPEQGLFSEDDLEILQGVGSQIAAALERTQLQSELERLVEARTAALAAEIAEHRRTEAALRQSEARIRKVIESSLLGVFFWHLDGRILDANDQFLNLLGYTREDLKAGRLNWKNLTPPEFEERDRRAFEEILLQGRCTPYEQEYLRKDGTRVPIMLGGALLPDEPERGVSFVFDRTEQRRLETQLRQAQKMEAVGRLAGGIAHDFNNLLTVILGEAEMALDAAPPEGALRESLQEIRRAGERAALLTRQLLAFSRKQVLQISVFDLNEVVTGLDKMVRRLIGEDIKVAIALAPEPLSIRADRGQIEQVIINLIVNARDAMPEGGELRIETASVVLDEEYSRSRAGVSPGLYAQLIVSDTGTGMSEEVKAHLFEPFFTTKETGKGTGLGLATSYGIVKQFGGHIEAYSELGLGTSMKVYLPRVGEAATAAAATAARPRGSETILLVEDDDLVREVTARILGSLGYRVVPAPGGEEALAWLRAATEPVHLLLTDVVLPKMGGRVIAEQACALRPGLRVLFASGYTDDIILHHQLTERGTAIIHKPFTPDQLAEKVRQVLDAT